MISAAIPLPSFRSVNSKPHRIEQSNHAPLRRRRVLSSSVFNRKFRPHTSAVTGDPPDGGGRRLRAQHEHCSRRAAPHVGKANHKLSLLASFLRVSAHRTRCLMFAKNALVTPRKVCTGSSSEVWELAISKLMVCSHSASDFPRCRQHHCRCRMSVSSATGLVGMQENAFLNDYFECLGFLPLASAR